MPFRPTIYKFLETKAYVSLINSVKQLLQTEFSRLPVTTNGQRDCLTKIFMTKFDSKFQYLSRVSAGISAKQEKENNREI